MSVAEPHGRSELAEIIEVAGADREHDGPVDAIVVVDRYVAEADRAAKPNCERVQAGRALLLDPANAARERLQLLLED